MKIGKKSLRVEVTHKHNSYNCQIQDRDNKKTKFFTPLTPSFGRIPNLIHLNYHGKPFSSKLLFIFMGQGDDVERVRCCNGHRLQRGGVSMNHKILMKFWTPEGVFTQFFQANYFSNFISRAWWPTLMYRPIISESVLSFVKLVELRHEGKVYIGLFSFPL